MAIMDATDATALATINLFHFPIVSRGALRGLRQPVSTCKSTSDPRADGLALCVLHAWCTRIFTAAPPSPLRPFGLQERGRWTRSKYEASVDVPCSPPLDVPCSLPLPPQYSLLSADIPFFSEAHTHTNTNTRTHVHSIWLANLQPAPTQTSCRRCASRLSFSRCPRPRGLRWLPLR